MPEPLPELILPGDWRISPGPGMTSIVDREMQAPLGASEDERRVRRHEMAHVRFSPLKHPVGDRHRLSWLAAEDGRVNILASRLDLATVPHVETPTPPSAPAIWIARAVLALQGGDATAQAQVAELLGRLTPAERAVVTKAADILHAKADNPGSAKRAAQLIDRALRGSDPPPTPPRLRPLGRLADHFGRPGRPPWTRPGTGNRWGVLEREDPPLHRRQPRGRTGSGPRPDETGIVPRYPHRAPIDGAVFATPRRAADGTVLVDVSGSMSIEPEELASLLDRAPALTVAVYAGLREGGLEQRKGYLRVVAAHGRMARAEELFSPRHGGGNVVDGPCLRWLARQRAPMLWVSDGEVTGIGDKQDPALSREVSAIISRHGIVRIRNLDDAERWIATRRSARGCSN
jgi:hypothetical protein